MNIIETLQYMKPDIKVLVWENDIDKIQYNELETFRPTKEDILAVDQNLVEQHYKQINEIKKQESIQQLEQKLIEIYDNIEILKRG